MKTILLTGSTGFLGHHLYERLKKNYHIIGLSRQPYHAQRHVVCDLVNDNQSTIDNIVQSFNPDYILHFAANPVVKNFNVETTMQNCVATHKLLEATPQTCEFILASSATVYGKHRTPRYAWAPTLPSSVYSSSKSYCESLVKLYYETYKKIKDYKILRFVSHVGTPNGLITDIIAKLQGPDKYLNLLGRQPGAKKAFIHVDDSLSYVERLLQMSPSSNHYWYNHIYNIGPNGRYYRSISVAEVAKLIMETLGIIKPIKWHKDSNWLGDNKCLSVCSDINISSEDSIKKYLNENFSCV